MLAKSQFGLFQFGKHQSMFKIFLAQALVVSYSDLENPVPPVLETSPTDFALNVWTPNFLTFLLILSYSW